MTGGASFGLGSSICESSCFRIAIEIQALERQREVRWECEDVKPKKCNMIHHVRTLRSTGTP